MLAIAAALMLSVCAGVAWAALAVILDREASLMVVPAAILAVLGAGWIGGSRRAVHAASAIVLTLMAAAYAMYLYAAALVAARVGLDLDQVFAAMGPEMLLAVLRVRVSPLSALLIVGTALLAGLVAARRHRPAPVH
jgi:hypothetical protein